MTPADAVLVVIRKVDVGSATVVRASFSSICSYSSVAYPTAPAGFSGAAPPTIEEEGADINGADAPAIEEGADINEAAPHPMGVDSNTDGADAPSMGADPAKNESHSSAS